MSIKQENEKQGKKQDQENKSKILKRKEKIDNFLSVLHALTAEFDLNLVNIHEYHKPNEYTIKIWLKEEETDENLG